MNKTGMLNIIVELSRMHGQAIDRAQAEALNTAVERGYDKWREEKIQNKNIEDEKQQS